MSRYDICGLAGATATAGFPYSFESEDGRGPVEDIPLKEGLRGWTPTLPVVSIREGRRVCEAATGKSVWKPLAPMVLLREGRRLAPWLMGRSLGVCVGLVCRVSCAILIGSRGWIQTHDLKIVRRPLCHLCYRASVFT